MGEMEQHHGRGEMTSQPHLETSNGGVLGLLRGAALIAILAGAGVSLVLMLGAGQRQNSRILLLLFGMSPLPVRDCAMGLRFFEALDSRCSRGVLYGDTGRHDEFVVDVRRCRLWSSQSESRVRIPGDSP